LFYRSQLAKLMTAADSWTHSNGGLSVSSGVSSKDGAWLQLYLFACKLLDLAITLPSDELPQFQMYRWAFVGDPQEETTAPRPPSSLPLSDDRSRPVSAATSAASTPVSEKRNSYGLGSMSSLSSTSTLTSNTYPGDRLSVNNNTSVLDSLNIRQKSPSPSPTPSRSSVASKASHSPVIPSYSGPFEPHVVRIEKTMRLKVKNVHKTWISYYYYKLLTYYSHSTETEPKSGDTRLQWKETSALLDFDSQSFGFASILPYFGSSY
jgi:hypothetical protein